MQKYFWWVPAIEQAVYTAWKKKNVERYMALTNGIRKGNIDKVPITTDVLQKWQEEWSKEEYREKYRKCYENRRRETSGEGTGVARHCGGSISLLRH